MSVIVTVGRPIQWLPGGRTGRLSDGMRYVRVWWLWVAVGIYNRDDYDLLTNDRGWVR